MSLENKAYFQAVTPYRGCGKTLLVREFILHAMRFNLFPIKSPLSILYFFGQGVGNPRALCLCKAEVQARIEK